MISNEGIAPFPLGTANHAAPVVEPPPNSTLDGMPGSLEDAFMSGWRGVRSSAGLACSQRQQLSPMHSCAGNE